jgi:hypothetical protein
LRISDGWADFMWSRCYEQSVGRQGRVLSKYVQSARASLSGEKKEMLGEWVEEGDT